MKRSRLQRIRSQKRRRVAQREQAEVIPFNPGLLQNSQATLTERHLQAVGMNQRYGNRAVQRAIATTDPMLHVGSRSAAVQSLQGLLNQAGFSLATDGIFGPQTRQAVLAFQQANGLKPDGVVGPQTWSALRGGGGGAAPQPEDPRSALVQAKLGQIKALFKLISDQPTTDQGQQAHSQVTMELPDKEREAEHSHDWMDDAMAWAGQKADEVGGAVSGAVGAASDWVGEKVDEASDWVGGAASSAADWASDKAGQAADWVGGAASSAGQWASDKAGQAADWAGNKAQQASDWANETANEVGTWISETAEEVGQAMQEEYDRLKEIVSDLGKSIDDALPKLDDLLNDLKKKAATLFGMDEEEEKEDPISFTMSDVSGAASEMSISCDGPVRRQRLNVSLNFVDSKGTTLGTDVIAHDEVRPNLTYNGFISQNDPKIAQVPKDDFGTTGSRVKIMNIKVDASYWGDYVNVTATVSVEASWAITQSPGRTDITSSDSDKVTEATWASIASDIDPTNATGHYKGAPPRRWYWCSDLTTAHEQYHANDIINFAKAYMPQATQWLGQQSVDVPFFDTDRQVRLQLNPLLETLTSQITQAINNHMGDTGEVRAHNAIRSSYEIRAEQIRMIAKQKKWKAK